MRRHTIILFAALLLAGPAVAQYTPYFQGDQITIGETEVGSVLVACDNLPWSLPEIEENYVWHGWIEATPDQLTLRFDFIYETSHYVAHLIGIAPREWREGKTSPWDDGMQAYARIYPNEDDPTRLGVEVVSVHGTYANLFDAGLVFTGAPPIWWDLDPEHWLIQWEITRFSLLVRSTIAFE